MTPILSTLVPLTGAALLVAQNWMCSRKDVR